MFCFTRELIPVEGDDKKVPDVFPDGFAICSPEGCHAVEDDGKRVHAKLPELLILILETFFQTNNGR